LRTVRNSPSVGHVKSARVGGAERARGSTLRRRVIMPIILVAARYGIAPGARGASERGER